MCACALLGGAGGLVVPALATSAEEYAVVVSPDVAVSDLSLEEVRRLFLFRQRYWKPGQSVTILLSEEGLRTGSFLLERVYRMDYPAFRLLILEKLYQEEIDRAPKVVDSDEAAVAFVSSGRGLVSLVRASAVRGRPVKVVAIGGSLPGSESYSLRR